MALELETELWKAGFKKLLHHPRVVLGKVVALEFQNRDSFRKGWNEGGH